MPVPNINPEKTIKPEQLLKLISHAAKYATMRILIDDEVYQFDTCRKWGPHLYRDNESWILSLRENNLPRDARLQPDGTIRLTGSWGYYTEDDTWDASPQTLSIVQTVDLNIRMI